MAQKGKLAEFSSPGASGVCGVRGFDHSQQWEFNPTSQEPGAGIRGGGFSELEALLSDSQAGGTVVWRRAEVKVCC